MKRKDVEDAVWEQAVSRGQITFEELNENFPAEYFPPHEMERFLNRLAESGVKVIVREGRRKTAGKQDRAA